MQASNLKTEVLQIKLTGKEKENLRKMSSDRDLAMSEFILLQTVYNPNCKTEENKKASTLS